MEVRELRICNLVKYKTTPEEYLEGEITLIDHRGVVVNGFYMLVGFIEPIPLTEEWLLKFGLKEHSLGYYYLTDDVIISVEGQVYFETGTNVTHWMCECYTVHQLQNLYFALTSEELTLNSNER
ncbi:hypothetical protein [Pedobacter sp. SYSU D00535]|uniref:hypothetical protein n=1 Tax=Pedobacter sp. SYSU D00535 TaxID=2810308 RepID=UPI001A95BBFE|nr:hypothetical protein [Pedobacter sp. SYSU D00535]